MKFINKKYSLPIITGFAVALLDLLFWIWFVVYGLMHPYQGIFEEGLWGMMIFHMPSSILLPVLGNSILEPFFTNGSIIPQTVFLFVVGICQYFIVGYLLGCIISFIKKRFKNRQEDSKKQDNKIIIEKNKKPRSIIKRVFLVFLATLFVSLLTVMMPKGLDGMLFGIIPVILIFFLLPFVSGILLILVQDKNRSYEFLPALLVGTVINNIAIVVVAYFVEYSRHLYLYKPPFNFYTLLDMFLFFAVLSLFGGLIGLVIRGTSEQFKKYPNSKIVLILKKMFGGIFLGIGSLGIVVYTIIFLYLFFNPSSHWLRYIMADFRIIDVIGFWGYYPMLISIFCILAIPLIFIINLGIIPLFPSKKYLNKKISLRLLIYFGIFLVIFLLSFIYLDSEFKVKEAEMKASIQENHINIKDFKNIYISPYVEFDDVIIKQGDDFDILIKGSEYDQIGLEFAKVDNTLNIKRSEFETFFNTNTWTVENRNILFRAGSKRLAIEITMPDIEKIENEGANVELENLEVDNLEIKLTHRFNNIKGNIKVVDTLKLDTNGGIINLTGSAKNLIINSGDCWIEMDKFKVEQATINAVNTSRLNVYVTDNMEVVSGENSGIINHFDK